MFQGVSEHQIRRVQGFCQTSVIMGEMRDECKRDFKWGVLYFELIADFFFSFSHGNLPEWFLPGLMNLQLTSFLHFISFVHKLKVLFMLSIAFYVGFVYHVFNKSKLKSLFLLLSHVHVNLS